MVIKFPCIRPVCLSPFSGGTAETRGGGAEASGERAGLQVMADEEEAAATGGEESAESSGDGEDEREGAHQEHIHNSQMRSGKF